MAERKPAIETFAKIKVVGVGGSGGAAVNRMVQSRIRGVDFVAVNTDIQALNNNEAKQKLHIGKMVTRGLGAGMNPEVGEKAAEESAEDIREHVRGSDMIFITCGLGGGTGSGAAPRIASLSRDSGALTIAFVTKPFSFEGQQRMDIANRSLSQLRDSVDAIITIPNDRILQVIDKKTSLLEAFSYVDEILRQGVQGIAELITVPGLINVDFADVKTIMKETGTALMGIGKASGENRAVEAAKAAITSPLLDVTIDGAKGILFTVVGGPSMTMNEVNEAAKVITASADPNAKIIFGAVINESLKDEIRVTVVATGFSDREGFSEVAAEANYQPTQFVEERVRPKEKTEEEKEESIFGIKKLQRKVAPTTKKKAKEQEAEPETSMNETEELDIPAFIRRKMK
ncbi:MAG: cell division protein FtsZ [Candidatus Buchananbacteria bacterium CG10_big_fil_rev_8_21_14_0_10_42_9]|uniref:Cell division protein FtsZ n=1 Tax=Candidatus Buchananbacteria bacterium CG10_big_fil_rev_8_21_14_0_10_42_9 TaxID=1974526 RepID=A0A2H0W3Z1_9BACT|nr:MAG: cell division protein FtsZ [Candidatus Buchananbacteria bacterium CG10_big_fil_rev_8_21_14_0_10_42_9]